MSPHTGLGTACPYTRGALGIPSASVHRGAGNPVDGDSMTPVKKPLRRGVAISIATLALACVGAAPAAAMLHPEPRSVPAHGPGSPLREGNRVLAEVRFEHGALAAVDELRSAGARILDASRPLPDGHRRGEAGRAAARSPRSTARAARRPCRRRSSGQLRLGGLRRRHPARRRRSAGRLRRRRPRRHGRHPLRLLRHRSERRDPRRHRRRHRRPAGRRQPLRVHRPVQPPRRLLRHRSDRRGPGDGAGRPRPGARRENRVRDGVQGGSGVRRAASGASPPPARR